MRLERSAEPFVVGSRSSTAPASNEFKESVFFHRQE